MIVGFFLIVAFLRSTPWRRQRRVISQPQQPQQQQSDNDETTRITTITENLIPTSTHIPMLNTTVPNSTSNQLSLLEISPISTQRRRSLKTHEVTFSGSVVGGSTDSDTIDTSTQKRRPSSPESSSSTSLLYRSMSSGPTQTTNSTEDYETALTETSRRLLRKKRIFSRFDTLANEDEYQMDEHDDGDVDNEADNDGDADADGDIEADDDPYDRDTDEFYSHIQDATGTSSGTRSKRSSLFSRSDSSATTTSSSGTFTGKRRSAASIISTSMCSDVIPLDRRRSSTNTEYSVRSSTQVQRRSSGRSRRNISRMTIAGARRRTTGRYNFSHKRHNLLHMIKNIFQWHFMISRKS